MTTAKKKVSSAKKVIIGMILGAIVGVILNRFAEVPFVDKYIVDILFAIGGGIFTNLIKMMVVPLVFFSLITGTSETGDITKLGRIGVKTMAIYLASTAVALIIALTTGLLLRPGVDLDLSQFSEMIANYTPKESVPLSETLLGIISTNPFESLAKGNMLQVLFVAILVGITITLLGDKARHVRQVFAELNDITVRMVGIVMKYAPCGVFFITAKTFTTLGFSAFKPLGMYILTTIVALIIHVVLCYGGLLVFAARCNPLHFIRNFSRAITMAFSTASSNATLPVALEDIKRCGVDPRVSSFTLPLGATVNMDGSAITQAVATVFIAQAFGMELTLGTLATIVLIATLSTVGNVGVPSASMVTLAMVFTQVGLPAEAIGIIIGVDYILSMIRTTLNVSGDAICTMVVAKSEGMFDKAVFDSGIAPQETAVAQASDAE